MNRKFLILLFVLTCVAGRAWAQMTDDQIIDYVQRGVTSGKNQQQLARELPGCAAQNENGGGDPRLA